MPKNQKVKLPEPEPSGDDGLPVNLDFGNLLNPEAQTEIREFYAALESSKACKTVLVGYTPPRD